MSGRIFQNVVLQFKETTDRTIGVIDGEGTVIACSELTGIGRKWSKYVAAIDAAEGECVALEGRIFKALPGWGGHFDYAVFASGDDSVGRTVCAMAAVALNSARSPSVTLTGCGCKVNPGTMVSTETSLKTLCPAASVTAQRYRKW